MAAGTWTLTNNAKLRMAKGSWNVDSATLKCALVTSSSNIGASSTTFAGVTNEVANANGYTTGGISVDLSFPSAAASIPVPLVTNPVWTASGGSITARSAVIYEVSGDVFAYVLLDSTPADVTASTGNTLTIDSDGTPAPVYTVS